MAGKVWTDEEDERLRKCVADGLSINDTARELGRPASSVQTRAKSFGVNWSRPPNPEAAASVITDARARRQAFRISFMGDLEQLRAQLFAPTQVYNFGGKDNTFAETTLPAPPIADQLRLVQAISAGISTIERLENLDADQGVADVVGMLDRIAGAIKKAAEEAAELL